MVCSVLIIDDEPNIVEGIKTILQREMPICIVVGVAYDGIQGMDMALSLKPDIILTDIKMPNLNGIEMIRQMLENGFASQFVIMTAYSEFHYAKSAIDLGVKSYITKPIDKQELLFTIQKIYNDKEKTKTDASKLQFFLNKYGFDIKEYALKKYIETQCADDVGVMSFFREMGMEMKKRKYCCAIFECASEAEEMIEEKLFRSIKEKLEKKFKQTSEAYVLHYSDNQIAVIFGIDRELDERNIHHALCWVWSEITAEFGKVVVGIGCSHEKKEIKNSLKEAKCALNYKIIKGGSALIHYRDIADIKDNMNIIETLDVKKLEASIENMDATGCRIAVEEIFGKLEKMQFSLDNLKAISFMLILLGIRKMPYAQFEISEYFGVDILKLENLSNFKSIEQLKNWIINILIGMNELMVKRITSEEDDVVEAAKKYMSKNIGQNITLKDLSERFFINPYYFSQLFKKNRRKLY